MDPVGRAAGIVLAPAGAEVTAPAAVWRGAAARRGRRGSVSGVSSAGERAQEELRWRVSARDAGTRRHTYVEVLQHGSSARTATEGTALIQADHGPRESGDVSVAWRIGRRSCGAKATAGRDELGGDAVQPGTTSSLHLYGSRGGSNATRV
jgi:hypothetical protein